MADEEAMPRDDSSMSGADNGGSEVPETEAAVEASDTPTTPSPEDSEGSSSSSSGSNAGGSAEGGDDKKGGSGSGGGGGKDDPVEAVETPSPEVSESSSSSGGDADGSTEGGDDKKGGSGSGGGGGKDDPVEAVEAPTDEATVSALYKQAATKFNIKQKDCIKFLIEKGLLKKGDAQGVANYLHRGDALSKRRVGEYLGSSDPFNQEVLTHFLNGYNFAGKTLAEALRMTLKEFRLPGEAQQIDRILEKFSARVFATNPEIGYANEDTVYILSFSLIMLNTDLHNPSIAPDKRMTMEGFVRNNKGINDGQDIERSQLEELFRHIKENEIKMSEGDQWEGEVVTFMAPNKSGWLMKANHQAFTGKWKKHWFVLSEHVLYYFDSPGEEKPKLILPMDAVRVGRSATKDLEFQILPANQNGFVKCTKLLPSGKMELQHYKDFVMKASTTEERDEWYEAMRDDVEPDPVQRMQRERARLLQQKQQMGKKKHSVSEVHSLKSGKDSQRLEGRGLLELPPPVARGWMHKRGENLSAWKRRYFALIDPPPEMNLGAAIYYFDNEKSLTRMLEIGEHTQKGQLFLEHVKKVSVATDDKDKSAIIQLVCELRTWKMRPETPESFNYWMEMLEKYVAKEHLALKQKAIAESKRKGAAAEEGE